MSYTQSAQDDLQLLITMLGRNQEVDDESIDAVCGDAGVDRDYLANAVGFWRLDNYPIEKDVTAYERLVANLAAGKTIDNDVIDNVLANAWRTFDMLCDDVEAAQFIGQTA